jgi:hypothetical protein
MHPSLPDSFVYFRFSVYFRKKLVLFEKILPGERRYPEFTLSPQSILSCDTENDGCKGELRRRRADGEDAHATLKEDAPEQMSCYTVKEVIGVSLCRVSSMNSRDKRAGRKRVHEDMCFAVRGGFGEDKDDAFIPNTRWVLLSELIKNVDKRELAALSKFAKALPERLKSAQQYLEEQRETDDE